MDKEDFSEISEAVKERIAQEVASYPSMNGEIGEKASSRFLDLCLNSNELGDGILYSRIQHNKFIFNTTSGEWMVWNGHFWEFDEGEKSLAAMEDIVDRYLEEVEDLTKKIAWARKKDDLDQLLSLETKRDRIFKRVSRLRSDRGRNAALKFSRTCKIGALTIRGSEFDLHPWLLACPNGVLDLRSGKFRDGRPGEYITKACSTEWQGLELPSPAWEAWLTEVFNGDEDVISCIQRTFGYAITGLNNEHILPVLWGQGRNGKGCFVETISKVLGPLAAPIQAEMLLDQGRSKNSSGPSPDIMALKGLRLAFASETDEGRRFSVARVKLLTGGDTLVGRAPHDKRETYFTPTHQLVLLTNNKPSAPSDDYAFWQRLILFPFTISFVDNPQAPNERKAIKGFAEELAKEAPAILSWLVRGCLEYQRKGINPPESVLKATAEYRREEDILADWIEEELDLNEFCETSAKKLYDNFSAWFERNISKRILSQKKWGVMMGRRFQRKKTSGVVKYVGIRVG